jgi:hypothetical protein
MLNWLSTGTTLPLWLLRAIGLRFVNAHVTWALRRVNTNGLVVPTTVLQKAVHVSGTRGMTYKVTVDLDWHNNYIKMKINTSIGSEAIWMNTGLQ